MTSYRKPGLLRRTLKAVAGALKRWVLGKSSHDYLKQFTGGEAYWEQAIASSTAKSTAKKGASHAH